MLFSSVHPVEYVSRSASKRLQHSINCCHGFIHSRVDGRSVSYSYFFLIALSVRFVVQVQPVCVSLFNELTVTPMQAYYVEMYSKYPSSVYFWNWLVQRKR